MVELASGYSGRDKGGKRRLFDKSWKREFHHGAHDAEYMTAFVSSARKALDRAGLYMPLDL